jgi:uncharacterized protein (DUF58 family)
MAERAIHRTIRRLLFSAPVLSRALLSGDFRSVFRGRGIEFDALREYDAEDDARLIDGRATARFGRAFVRTYREDRNLTVLLVLDESASMAYGTDRTRGEAAGIAAALLAYAAALNGTAVGALFFDAQGVSFVPPRAGRRAALSLTERFASPASPDAPRAQAAAVPSPRRPGLGGALESACRVLKRRSLVFVLSDFRCAAEGPEGYERPLGQLASRHDVVALRVTDPVDEKFPASRAAATVFDAETSRPAFLAFGGKSLEDSWSAFQGGLRLSWLRAVRASGAASFELRTDEDPGKALVSFFERRRRRR